MDLLARVIYPPWGDAGVTVRAVFAGVLVSGHTTHHTLYNILSYNIQYNYILYVQSPPTPYTLYRPIISTVLYIVQSIIQYINQLLFYI